ncbi:uncharacterized protein LOC111869200 isoform X2 [Cryptotermes secundus]|uniref:uncharacterized protein LOC111869200 isoform X2 n=1 Tax=Cryptotermes secundus TaxID=105785 RepID=UPI001454DC74|nr:uncharacterized protein LOC111869200 isoform X2 [Cryptotermes secundus]
MFYSGNISVDDPSFLSLRLTHCWKHDFREFPSGNISVDEFSFLPVRLTHCWKHEFGDFTSGNISVDEFSFLPVRLTHCWKHEFGDFTSGNISVDDPSFLPLKLHTVGSMNSEISRQMWRGLQIRWTRAQTVGNQSVVKSTSGVTYNVLSSNYAIGPMNSTANVIEVRQNVQGVETAIAFTRCRKGNILS